MYIMKNNKETYTDIIRNAIADLPFFSVNDLASLDIDKKYIKILMYRFVKTGEILRFKKGIYVSKKYLDKVGRENKMDSYMELVAVSLYEPSYLSMEYVLSEYGILTESVRTFTLASVNKTKKFVNDIGLFNYKRIKNNLFFGFKIVKKDGFLISKATVAKALFDFLYFRKKTIFNKDIFSALRLNLENLKKEDLRELKKYAEIEGSKKMNEIIKCIWEKKK